MKTLITNAHIISPGIDLVGGSVLIVDNRIADVLQPGAPLPEADKTIDAGGNMLLPGFIDIHSHGAGGCDTCDCSVESIRTIADCKMKEGVTTWLPTTLTLGTKTLMDVCECVKTYAANPTGSKTPGVHLEGPYINPRQCGAQNPAFVRPADIDEVMSLAAIYPVLYISLAPEMPGALEFIAQATAAGITCSAGHSAATHADFMKAKAAGLKHLTHFCNQMSPQHHREIGLVGSGMLDRDIKIEIICDTIHLCRDMLNLTFTNKDISQMIMITDSLACSWMPDGPGQLGGLPIMVKDGVARLESGNLAGSTLRYAKGLKNVHEITGRPLSELVKATSLNQAESLGLKGLGKVSPGYTADLVLLNADFDALMTIIDGEVRYTA
ncbi:MAG TPA: N-acetylglucosamine-6-phosphate deacetylase [Candidatus Akkermansia intestinigallinarum]|uniref:N-acetylglucosamine-6-phosphate deacetylase n=1 Tax=Candidatus Akkermansia intestinigallinarum TaxID=2838431 RepID=A0A9D1VBX1_9BACT|nr:N-acetylglucosamine-6-phosphate deacetylase [Candidatus Akkermansia intestinigallinarum]